MPLFQSAFTSPARRPGGSPGGSVLGESVGGEEIVFHDTDDTGIRVLDLDYRVGGYCGGQVGKGGNKMCILPGLECRYKRHRVSKANIKLVDSAILNPRQCVFVDTKSPNTVFTSDVLPAALLPNPIEFYEHETRPLKLWGEFFRAAALRKADTEVEALEAMVGVHDELLESPYKKRRTGEDMDEEETSPSPSSPASVEVKLAHLAALIGKQRDGSSPESILAQISRLEGIVEKGTLSEDDVIALESLLGTYGRDLAGLRSAAAQEAIKQLEEGMQPLVDWFKGWSAVKADGSLASIGSELDAKLENLEQRIVALSGEGLSGLGRSAHPATPLFGAFAATPSIRAPHGGEVALLENQLKLLQEKVEGLQEQMGGKVITIGGTSFRSKGELRSWLKVNVVDEDLFICFADPCALLNMASKPGEDNKEMMSFHSNARKSGLGGGLMVLARLSFNFGLPVIFGSSSKSLAARDIRVLPGVKTAEAWDNGSPYSGLKNEVLEQVRMVVKVLQDGIQSPSLSPEARTVAMECVCQSSLFITSLFTWMTTTYHGGIADGQNPTALWSYISHSVRALFNSLHEARSSGQRPKADAADILWGFFQGLKLAGEFNDVNFSGHQVLSHVLNLHLHDRAVMKESLESKLKAIQKSVDGIAAEAKEELKSMKRSLDSVRATADRAQAEASRAKNQPRN